MSDKKLTEMPNIGKELEKKLIEIGIDSSDDLIKSGSISAWLKIRGKHPTACLNTLYALEGAIAGVKWQELPEDRKRRMKVVFETYEKQNN